MCCLNVKHGGDFNTHCAKICIVVLGNHKDRYYEKSKLFVPVFKYSSLRMLTSKAIGQSRILQQGDCKNAFCNATLPPDETTVIKPTNGDPDASPGNYWLLNKTLYGLRRSPNHFFNMIKKILTKMGLQASRHDPCLFSSILEDPLSRTQQQEKIHIGLCVDDFVLFSKSSKGERRFRDLLSKEVIVDFNGDIKFFLCATFTWHRNTNTALPCHTNQQAFTEHTAERFGLATVNRVPNVTPYRSGMPIDAVPDPDPDDHDLARRTTIYQSIVGSLNWLSTCTCLDISPAITFLSSYQNNPSVGHYKAAIYALNYSVSTSSYGISYHLDCRKTTLAYLLFPDHHKKEAYLNAIPSSPSEAHKLTTYTDACWGGKFGSAVPDGTPLSLFKFRSLSGYLICRTGGPLSWKSIFQEQTSLSSCEAEIHANDEATHDLLSVRHQAIDLGLSDAYNPTDV